MADMKYLKYVYYLLIAVGILAVSLLVYSRHDVEKKMDTLEIAVDYVFFEQLAYRDDRDVEEVLRELKKVGVTSVVIEEDNLENLSNNVKADLTYTLYSELKKKLNWKKSLPDDIVRYLQRHGDKMTLLVETSDFDLFQMLVNNLEEKYGSEICRTFRDENTFRIVIHAGFFLKSHNIKVTESDPDSTKNKKESYVYQAQMMGLGFNTSLFDVVNKAGFKIILRSNNYKLADSSRQFEYYKKILSSDYDFSKTVLFSGFTAFGIDKFGAQNLSEIASFLKKNGYHVGMVESANQLGFYEFTGDREIAHALGYDAVRTYIIPDFIRKKLNYLGLNGPKEIENAVYRAVTDRSIRLVVVRPFIEVDDWFISDLDIYGEMISGLTARLQQHGIKVGDAQSPGNPIYSKWLYLFTAYGIGSLFLLMLRDIYANRKLEMILVLLMVFLLPVLIYINEKLSIQAAAFFATVFFPSFSIFVGMKYLKRSHKILLSARHFSVLTYSLIAFLLITGISLIGGFYTGALLSRKEYILEFWYFKGVKLSLILPALISIPLYFFVFGFFSGEHRSVRGTLRKILRSDVKVYMLILVGVLGGISLLYLLRSGNTGKTSATEELFRSFLENVLIARPRNKEFLIAFPALFIAIFLTLRGMKNFILPFVILAMVGLSSIQNSFCHTRTPIRISFYRSLISVLISFVIGIVLVLAMELIHTFIIKWKEKKV